MRMSESGRTARRLAAIVYLGAAAVHAQETQQQAAPGAARTLARPDLALRYVEYGSGEPILVLAGGPGLPGEFLEPLAQMIAERARAIVPDQRGTGGSIPKEATAVTLEASVADLEALRLALGLDSWTVAGHSWGGRIALDYASRFPSSVKGLILVSSGGTSSTSYRQVFLDNLMARMCPDDRAAYAYWSQPAVRANDSIRADMEIRRVAIPSAFYDPTRATAYLAAFRPGKEHYNPEAAEHLIPDYERSVTSRVAALSKLQIRALIVHGRQDPMPESVALENAALLKGSRLVWLDQCGHVPWLEQPNALKKALFEFLFP